VESLLLPEGEPFDLFGAVFFVFDQDLDFFWHLFCLPVGVWFFWPEGVCLRLPFQGVESFDLEASFCFVFVVVEF